jgi:hypothetical protein
MAQESAVSPTIASGQRLERRRSGSEMRSFANTGSGRYVSTAKRRHAPGMPFSWCSPRSVRV